MSLHLLPIYIAKEVSMINKIAANSYQNDSWDGQPQFNRYNRGWCNIPEYTVIRGGFYKQDSYISFGNYWTGYH